MAWNGFFSRNPLKTGLGIFGTGLTFGLSISTWLAFATRDRCAAAAIALVHHLGKFVDIPKVTGEIDVSGELVNFTVNNLNITIPKAVAEIVDGVETIPGVCFDAAFIIGLTVSVLASAAVANAAVAKILAGNQQRPSYTPLINSADANTRTCP